MYSIVAVNKYAAGIYLFNINLLNQRTHQNNAWNLFKINNEDINGVFIINFEPISNVLMIPLFCLNK